MDGLSAVVVSAQRPLLPLRGLIPACPGTGASSLHASARPGLRPAAASIPGGEPLRHDQRHIIGAELRVRSQQVHAFVLRLGNEHAIERVAVVLAKGMDKEDMFHAKRQ